jgi:polyisoprenoid-binding protein YceI
VLLAYWVAIMSMAFTTVADEIHPPPYRDSARRYTIDSGRTVVSFEVRSLGIFRQRGWFGASYGHVALDVHAAEGTFDVVIDATTIQASSDARLRIIRGAGFLNVEQFPEITYKAKHVAFNNGKPIRVDGELTLLGITHPVPLKVSAYQCTSPADETLRRCSMDASAMFRRSDFGMTGSMPLAGNRVRLAIHAEATAEGSMRTSHGGKAEALWQGKPSGSVLPRVFAGGMNQGSLSGVAMRPGMVP